MSRDQEDLRVRRTHKLLWEALMTLLIEQTFEQITVKEICEQAMVHRTTFYQHYEDKYALLGQGMRERYASFIAEVNGPPSAFSPEQPPPYFTHLFAHVADHQPFYTSVLCSESGGTFQKFFRAYLVEQTEAKIYAFASPDRRPVMPPALHAQYVVGAVLSTLTWWLENDMPYSPRQMAGYLQAL